MKSFRLFCLILAIMALVATFMPVVALAQTPTPTPTETPTSTPTETPTPTSTPTPASVNMSAKYPRLEVTSGETAQFEMNLNYRSSDETDSTPRTFDLVATAPKDWTVEITPQYSTSGAKIASIQLTPGFSVGETVMVKVTPSAWVRPDPGEYPVTVVATSKDIKGSIELKAVVTGKYALAVVPNSGRYSTAATAGKEQNYTIVVQNTGYSPINDVSFTVDKPENWTVEYTPNKIDSLAAGSTQNVEVKIKPESNTISGDYVITLKTTAKQTSAADTIVRITVNTKTIWGVVGIVVVVIVVVGLVFTFRQFSRR